MQQLMPCLTRQGKCGAASGTAGSCDGNLLISDSAQPMRLTRVLRGRQQPLCLTVSVPCPTEVEPQGTRFGLRRLAAQATRYIAGSGPLDWRSPLQHQTLS